MIINFIIIVSMNRCRCLAAFVIAETKDAKVIQCSCGNFHLDCGTFHKIFTPEEFIRASRVLKLALGALVARNTKISTEPKRVSTTSAFCLACGQIIRLRYKKTSHQSDQVAKRHGFRLASTNLKIFGYCAWCLASNKYMV